MSLLWKTASEHGVVRVPMSEFKTFRSGDFDAPITESRHWLQQDWDNYLTDSEYMGTPVGHPDHNPEDFAVHSNDVKHGGLSNYIEHLKRDLAQNGQQEPVEVRDGNVVIEGHHRAVALMELGAPFVKVKHVR